MEKLLKRKVIQAGAVYVAVAWGAVEILLTMQEQLGWADLLPKAALALFVTGFPIVIIWSWFQDRAQIPITSTHNITPERNAVEEESGSPSFKQGKIHFVTARDGVRLAYAVTGEGPALVKAAHWQGLT